MADNVRRIDSAPRVQAAKERTDAEHAARTARVVEELTGPRQYGKFPAPDEDTRKAWHRAARAAAKQLGKKVISRRTSDQAVIITVAEEEPNPLREQRDAARLRNAMDRAFGQ
ncbi:hypothetical protein HDA32_004129 [Spinactinospora alkalitolerans]|uniref:Uncharacterized protein n=1 Tax=Spinactinospora alkalitolerans TaxID=687207 RepID=A0A852TYD7_9ACTN|nr:hypothetical protein [Spinactinospora alkalitolerans]NYE49009.1 hypothetical protein [Spinactinospora alkalitolerans]